MEDNDKVAAFHETFEEIDECAVKIEQQIDPDTGEITEKYFDFNLGVNDLLETEDPKPILVKLNKQPLVTKLQSQVFMIHSYNSYNWNTAGRNLVPKYRPIRPKPCAGGDKFNKVKSKLVEIPPALPTNMSALNRPNCVVVNGNVVGIHDKNRTHGIHDKNGTHGINNKNGTHGTYDKDEIHNTNRIPRKKQRATIELFFDSMARSVSKLPAEIQAEIKMEICKLVTKAEIKHYGSQPK